MRRPRQFHVGDCVRLRFDEDAPLGQITDSDRVGDTLLFLIEWVNGRENWQHASRLDYVSPLVALAMQAEESE